MIDLALSRGERYNPQVTALLPRARQGDEAAMAELYQLLLTPAMDSSIQQPLKDLRETDAPSAWNRLMQYVDSRIRALRKNNLVPQATTGTLPGFGPEKEWDALAGDIFIASERLWRDMFLSADFKEQTDIRKTLRKDQILKDLETRVTQSRTLLLIWLEVSLYYTRAISDATGRQIISRRDSRDHSMRAEARKLVEDYFEKLKEWDQDLRPYTGKPMFVSGPGDAIQLRRLSREFSPAQLEIGEDGWGLQADDARTELRYQAMEEHRRGRWRTGHPFAALIYAILGITTGYGTRPRRFVITVALMIAAAGLAFFLNDLFNPGITTVYTTGRIACQEMPIKVTSVADVVALVLHYLYVSVTNLTTLGSNSTIAPMCGGPSTQLLLTTVSILGYFLLALLAALFFQMLSQND
jgi:hypothetical protein